MAAEEGHRAVAEALLAGGADPNARGSSGQTPLHGAAGNGHTSVVELLVSRGADPNATDLADNTAIIWAASTGHLGALEALAAGGADVNLANNADNTPLHYAAARGYLLMVGALIGLGASSSRKNKEGKTPQEMLGTGPADRLFCLAQECAAAEKERRKMQDQLAEAQSCESEAMAHEAETEDLKGRTADPQERIAALQRQFKKQEEKVKNLLSSMEDFRLKEIQPPGDDQASASGRRKSSRLASRSGTARRDRQSTGSSGKRNTP